jgi:hypothetical protein
LLYCSPFTLPPISAGETITILVAIILVLLLISIVPNQSHPHDAVLVKGSGVGGAGSIGDPTLHVLV